MLLPYDGIFSTEEKDMWGRKKRRNKWRYVQASVLSVDCKARKVHLDDGDKVPYDFLVVATGGPQSMLVSRLSKCDWRHSTYGGGSMMLMMTMLRYNE